ncbi:MAG TPA: hypothetical protein VN442_13895 [Bryobacteraceae bacterium]|nr:hypothetical protein [Bryobacteraceae bacterium]
MTAACLILAALVPGLYWDRDPATAPALKQAGIERIYVPAERLDEWRRAGFEAVPFRPEAFEKATPPGVEYKIAEASATRMPWVDANGWRFVREGARAWFYEAAKGTAALAAAEPFAYGVQAVVHPDAADLPLAGRMLAFLRRIEAPPLPAMVNIAVIDDGSETTAEVLNLLARRNLLFKVTKAPDPNLLTVRIGSPEYPVEESGDPFAVAVKVRQQLTDEKRLVRIYGSEVVLARLTGDGSRARLHLLNYGRRPVQGLRVRLLGEYRDGQVLAFGAEPAAPADWSVRDGGTEFTIPAIDTYAVVDLLCAETRP